MNFDSENKLIRYLIDVKHYFPDIAWMASMCWHDGLYLPKQWRRDIREWEDSLRTQNK